MNAVCFKIMFIELNSPFIHFIIHSLLLDRKKYNKTKRLIIYDYKFKWTYIYKNLSQIGCDYNL